MAQLEDYTYESKVGFSLLERITTGSHFDDWYKRSKKEYSGENVIFRGMPEARYKLFTSSQRLLCYRDLSRFQVNKLEKDYFNFLMTLKREALEWNGKLIPNFYKNAGVVLNDFAMFSFMQHHGIPTPLLDFTTDIDIGLYFAFRGTQLTPSNDLVDNFVYLYVIDTKSNNLNLTDPIGHDLASVYDKSKLILFAEVKEPIEDSSSQRPRFTNTNFNIINQKGVFVFNYHPWMPICPGIPREIKPTPHLPDIKCIDIHKSIKERILSKIAENGILEDRLFADFTKFKNEVTFNALAKYSK